MMEILGKRELIIGNKEVVWPDLPLDKWEETYSTIHLCSQIIGKIKLQFAPLINHWWNITFSVSASGLTTGIIPYGDTCFEIEFNFIEHKLNLKSGNGSTDYIDLKPGTIAEFYFELKEKLSALGIEINIWTVPVEMEDRMPFDKDYRPRKYDPDYARRFWKILVQVSKVMSIFRSGFTGKSSPVHFFWGSLDLAVTFFSGRSAPEHPGSPNVGRKVMIESYNAELASFGFWGGKGLGEAAFYTYAYPEPDDYKKYKIYPKEAYYNEIFRDFILPYSIVRNAEFPEKVILGFYKSTFKAAAELGNWDKSIYR
ncbi:MAG TPA: DUF5996 family protein [Cytophagaceae bacterium]|jgi:hypothetical protein|nr:DUF5996 family protein [Cytophagaceae bacterium]